MSDLSNSCPCCSGKTFENCCKPILNGVLPESALALMRSRYTAYTLDLPDYIINTTHLSSPQYTGNKFAWKRNISKFSQKAKFQKLDILDFKEKGRVATVTFTVYMTLDDQEATYTEKSYFEKVKNQWLYHSGQLEEGHAPHLITEGELKLLPLAYYGDPILRKKADPISIITPEIKKLAEEMIETMKVFDGCGLAAPQIHHSIRLFVIQEQIENEEEEESIEGEIIVMINPKLSSPSEKTWIATEGCLSIPAIRSDVERPYEITVEYTTLDGQVVERRFDGWTAKIIMHENDHINGVLFIDRLTKDQRKMIEPQLETIEKTMHDGLAF